MSASYAQVPTGPSHDNFEAGSGFSVPENLYTGQGTCFGQLLTQSWQDFLIGLFSEAEWILKDPDRPTAAELHARQKKHNDQIDQARGAGELTWGF